MDKPEKVIRSYHKINYEPRIEENKNIVHFPELKYEEYGQEQKFRSYFPAKQKKNPKHLQYMRLNKFTSSRDRQINRSKKA